MKKCFIFKRKIKTISYLISQLFSLLNVKNHLSDELYYIIIEIQIFYNFLNVIKMVLK